MIDYEEEIKHLFVNFNLSAEIYYDDIVATVNGFSGNFVGYYWDCHDQVYTLVHAYTQMEPLLRLVCMNNVLATYALAM